MADPKSLNVARLANVPESTLRLAAIKSKELEDRVMWSNVDNLYALLFGFWKR